jgi:hypothetical protein
MFSTMNIQPFLRGYSARHAGIVLIALPEWRAFFSPLAGGLSDKIEPRVVASIGMGFFCGGLVPVHVH